MKPAILTEGELTALLERVRGRVEPGDYEILQRLAETVRLLSTALAEKTVSLARLRAMLFGESTEKTDRVLGQPPRGREQRDPREPPPKGHGRHAASDYPGAVRVPVAHPELKPESCCPSCGQGKIYRLGEPGKLIVIVGQPALTAKIYEPERLRCSRCGEVFTAPLPPDVPNRKYDETAGAMIALLKYGTGFPFYRMASLQETLGVPLPATTAWEIVLGVAEELAPIHEELQNQAAQAEVLHNDDTTMTVLSLSRPSEGASLPAEQTPASPSEGPAAPAEQPPADKASRTGVFTSGIVATREGNKIAIFATGRRHAGENLASVLARRDPALDPPIQMCDALSRNAPEPFKAILANCLAHGRRKFVEQTAGFPDECRVVLEKLRDVYRNEAEARRRGLGPAERLAFHQVESGPIMAGLKEYLTAQLEQKRVEPNSGLGKAIAYLLKHWEPLTLFLRQPGAPLDNNICERALKMAILHRKNALFYKTERGAWVGDVLMSLIHTCRLNGTNPFEYLTALLKHVTAMRKDPAAWMPWNYKRALRAVDTS